MAVREGNIHDNFEKNELTVLDGYILLDESENDTETDLGQNITEALSPISIERLKITKYENINLMRSSFKLTEDKLYFNFDDEGSVAHSTI